MKNILTAVAAVSLILGTSLSCSGPDDENGGGSEPVFLGLDGKAPPKGQLLSVADLPGGSGDGSAQSASESWKGDLGGMIDRRIIRALVIPSKTSYFLDGATQRGVTFEALTQLEEELNKTHKTGNLKVYVVVIPTTRDRILPDLVAGRGDIAAANLTPTPTRAKKVDFLLPFLKDVSEVVVTSAGAPNLSSLEDLSGKKVFIRRSSSYWEHLEALNDSFFTEAGRKPVKLKAADEMLETEDILEMANAGLVDITIADSYLADFWSQFLNDIRVYKDLAVHSGTEISWAIRKDSPELKQVLETFVEKHKKGTLLGNILFKRYLENTTWVENSLSADKLEQFNSTIGLFEKYAGEYGFDYLMITAQAYQESGLDHTKRSRAGAVGIMQVLKSTAADPNVGIPEIDKIENNIHAGVKYLKYLSDRYFADPAIDQINRTLLAFAAYNAGPSRVAKLRQKTEEIGLDPNVWFRNVEVVAAKEVGRETVQYVSNIFKYYIAYQGIITQSDLRAEAKK